MLEWLISKTIKTNVTEDVMEVNHSYFTGGNVKMF
jgi:hypothetical protein